VHLLLSYALTATSHEVYKVQRIVAWPIDINFKLCENWKLSERRRPLAAVAGTTAC